MNSWQRQALVAGLGALAATLSLLGCTSSQGEPVRDVEAGALGLQCKRGEIEVGKVEYTITRHGAPVRNGSFDIDEDETRFSAVIGPLPSGNDYTISLRATALRVKSGESSDCSGDGGFSVAAHQTTVVAITLRCGGIPKRGPDDNQCPHLDSVRAFPSECLIGSTAWFRADAHDPDKKVHALRFEWNAHEGTLSDPNESQTSFQCAGPGRPAITVKISDGDDTCPEESVTFFVNCRHASSMGAAGSFGSVMGGVANGNACDKAMPGGCAGSGAAGHKTP